MLLATDISKAYSDRTLFSGLTLNVAAGDRIALVGPNGSGKTTLLDILAGETEPETGSITRQRNLSFGYLKQETAAFTGQPLLQEVLDAGVEANALTATSPPPGKSSLPSQTPTGRPNCSNAWPNSTLPWKPPAAKTGTTRPS